jgi:sugar phosphate isomerase/epimerase
MIRGFTSLGHVAIRVTDIDRSLDFYVNRLGFQEMLRLHRANGDLWLVYLRITDDQYLEVFPYAIGEEAPPPERFIDVASILGERPLLIPSFLPPQLRPSDVDGWKRIGAELGRGAEAARASGLRVAWHNHEFEFRLLPDGSRPIDHILAEAGEGLGFEIDFAWVARGWADPEAELRRFASRIVAIQIKDTAPPGTLDDENGWRAAGDGTLDWDHLWPLFTQTSADHLVVEHDRPLDWRAVAQDSYDFARSRSSGNAAC